MKRLLDIALSLLVLLLLLPLLLLVGLAIFLDDGMPVLFSQSRVGLGGRSFKMLKFRSMCKDAAVSGPYFTEPGDSRITRVGRFIRRTSIDELPQLLNVLNGDMSLVGPRPDVEAQRSLYAPEDWTRRCSVRPGITGLAQVNGRSEITWERRLELDLQYVRDSSGWSDIRILWATLAQLGGRHSN